MTLFSVQTAEAAPSTKERFEPEVLRGTASFYGGRWHGKKTANGEIYDKNTYTAAHKSLKFGTLVKVKNLRNGREVVVRINNRGPYIKGRIIDLSVLAANELKMINSGVAPVEVTVLPKNQLAIGKLK